MMTPPCAGVQKIIEYTAFAGSLYVCVYVCVSVCVCAPVCGNVAQRHWLGSYNLSYRS